MTLAPVVAFRLRAPVKVVPVREECPTASDATPASIGPQVILGPLESVAIVVVAHGDTLAESRSLSSARPTNREEPFARGANLAPAIQALTRLGTKVAKVRSLVPGLLVLIFAPGVVGRALGGRGKSRVGVRHRGDSSRT